MFLTSVYTPRANKCACVRRNNIFGKSKSPCSGTNYMYFTITIFFFLTCKYCIASKVWDVNDARGICNTRAGLLCHNCELTMELLRYRSVEMWTRTILRSIKYKVRTRDRFAPQADFDFLFGDTL